MHRADKIKQRISLLRFFITQRFVGFPVPDNPHLDKESTALFMSLIRDCRFYLEYGSGGSTVVAARLNQRFVSVETDRRYLKSVRKTIGSPSPNQRLVYAHIGLTGLWGSPVRTKRLTTQRLKHWTDYLEAPWQFMGPDESPDLILIDGRFRVAATLTCCAHLLESSDVSILVDDYVERPHYHVIEKYATLTATVGGMAIFRPALKDVHELKTAIAQYSGDWG
jgi:hypothetical protein